MSDVGDVPGHGHGEGGGAEGEQPAAAPVPGLPAGCAPSAADCRAAVTASPGSGRLRPPVHDIRIRNRAPGHPRTTSAPLRKFACGSYEVLAVGGLEPGRDLPGLRPGERFVLSARVAGPGAGARGRRHRAELAPGHRRVRLPLAADRQRGGGHGRPGQGARRPVPGRRPDRPGRDRAGLPGPAGRAAVADHPDRGPGPPGRRDGRPVRGHARHSRSRPASTCATSWPRRRPCSPRRRRKPVDVVAIQPSTGRVLAVVERPGGFDRALQGEFPPGSTFKVVTASALANAAACARPARCSARAR